MFWLLIGIRVEKKEKQEEERREKKKREKKKKKKKRTSKSYDSFANCKLELELQIRILSFLLECKKLLADSLLRSRNHDQTQRLASLVKIKDSCILELFSYWPLLCVAGRVFAFVEKQRTHLSWLPLLAASLLTAPNLHSATRPIVCCRPPRINFNETASSSSNSN